MSRQDNRDGRDPIKPNRVPIGQISRGVDEVMGTNTQQAYEGIANVVRGNFIPGGFPVPEVRRLAKMNPNDVIPPVEPGQKNQARSVVGANDLTMESLDRIDSAKTYKRPGSRGLEVKRIADIGNNPRMDNVELRMNNMETILKEMSYQFDAMASKYDLMVKKGRLGDNNESELRIRMDQSIRQLEEHNHLMSTDMINRISTLENRLSNEERVKAQLKEKLMIAEQNFKEISNFIQTFQKLDNSEINQMRILIQDKISEDQQLIMKEREKAKALFNEIVRIGELQEKQSKDIYGLNSELESRLRGLESKFVLNEQNMNQLLTKGETGINYMSEWNQKLDGRVQQLETNLIGLGKEQMKDRDSLARMEALNQKITDDLKQLLQAIQTDYQTRLDSRISEVLNRIVIEHEERKRTEEDIKHQMDIRSKLHEEKMNYEKEEMRDRYMAMDSLVRAEFQRKEEAIRSLAELLETNVKRIQQSLKQDEISREQFEAALRIEMQKMQEVLNRDLDFFKSQFALENEKITEIIKGEIDTRFSSDVELKNLTNLMLSSITTEINEFKAAIEKQNKLFATELKEISQDSAERDNQLSKFVEMETKKVLDTANGKYDKLKYLLTRVAEQFKAHLKKFEKSNQDMKTEITENTLKINELNGELASNIGTLEQKINQMVHQEMKRLEKENEAKFRLNEDIMRKLDEKQCADFDVLKTAIENEADINNQKIDKLAELSEQYHKNNFMNLKMLVAELDKIRGSLFYLDQELEGKWQEINNRFIDLRSDLVVLVNTESVKRKDFDEYLESHLTALKKAVEDTIAEIEERFNNTHTSMNLESEEMRKKLEKMDAADKKMAEKIDENFEVHRRNLVRVIDDLNNTTVYTKTLDLMTKTLSARTYQEFNELHGMMDSVGRLLGIEKTHQVKEAESIRKILGDLNRRVDVELPDQINTSVMKVLEKVKEESIKIWEVCLDYAQKVDPKSQEVIKKGERLDNYTYAVGGRDNYGLPVLGEVGGDEEDDDNSVVNSKSKGAKSSSQRPKSSKPKENEDNSGEGADEEPEEGAEEGAEEAGDEEAANEEGGEEGEEEAEEEQSEVPQPPPKGGKAVAPAPATAKGGNVAPPAKGGKPDPKAPAGPSTGKPLKNSKTPPDEF